MMSDKPHSIHHVNFPTTDPERTKEWYGKVFSMKRVDPKSNTDVLLMTRGTWDLHFTPVPKEEWRRMMPSHFAIETEDFAGFLKHLESLGIRYTKPVERPQNNSKFCYITDPDGTVIELTYHGKLHVETAVSMDEAKPSRQF
jgi:catechol 2,3-dioxygenase-like lactoylglutathione lyase family enzyme